MLTICKDWRAVLGGAVAADLVAQVHAQKVRNEVASRLIAASLDLLVATWPRRINTPLQVKTLSNVTWQIGALHYMYLPPNDDAAIGTCINLARRSELTVIMPRFHESVKRRLLSATLRGRAPNTWSFDSFISWRTTCASIDQGWPSDRALVELLAAYNRRAIAAGQDDSMLVDVPKEP